jgi:osmotically inducible protein OsmC
MALSSGSYEGPFTYASRFEDGPGTNPEELIGAAHAGCFSMFLSALLSNAGYVPTRIQTTARVHIAAGPTITTIELDTEAEVPNLDEATFQEKAADAKAKCPVSKALASVDIKLNARLVG